MFQFMVLFVACVLFVSRLLAKGVEVQELTSRSVAISDEGKGIWTLTSTDSSPIIQHSYW